MEGSANINATVFHPNLIVRSHFHNNARGILWVVWLIGIGAVHFNPRLFNKRSHYDEEDQHDENDVQHGRQIDLTFFLCASGPAGLIS